MKHRIKPTSFEQVAEIRAEAFPKLAVKDAEIKRLTIALGGMVREIQRLQNHCCRQRDAIVTQDVDTARIYSELEMK